MSRISILKERLRWKLRKLPDTVAMFIVWKLLPRRIVMWSCVRVGAHATTGRYAFECATTITFMEALKRWDEK